MSPTEYVARSGPDAVAAWVASHPELVGSEMEFAARTPLFAVGQPCRGFPWLLRGEVQVFRASAQGRRLELYRVGAGEICLVSTASLFSGEPLSADAVTTQDSVLRLLSPEGFQRMAEDAELRAFLFQQFASRLADLVAVTDAVAFQRLDRRLAAALLGHGPVVQASHQELAHALGTAREIVTRLLRRFEQEEWVELGRNEIRIKSARALRAFAASEV